MNVLSTLENIGLSEKEAKIYLALLKLQEALPSAISRHANVKRPTAYVILAELQRKGLVSRFMRKKTTYFRALSPHNLLEDQHNKYTALQNAVPELLQLHQKYAATPQMSVFEGKEGMIKIMEDTLTTKTELLCWADVEEATNALAEYYPTYISKKVARKIFLRGIICYGPRALRFKKYGPEELREVYLVPRAQFPFHNEINIYDDKVAIISHRDEIGVIIQNQTIADTQRSIFELCFSSAKILEKTLLTPKDLTYLAQKKENIS